MASDESKSLFLEQIKDMCEQLGVSKTDAFSRWVCQNILSITDEGSIDEAVSIGGKNDYGVDIFHAEHNGDVTEQYICWIQAKFSETLDHVVNREEIETFASTFGHLKNCPNLANMTFKQKSTEFVKMTKQYPHIRKKMIFAVAGRANEQVQALVKDPQWLEEKFDNNNIILEILDLNEILSRMIVSHTPQLQLHFDGQVITRKDTSTDKKSIIGYMTAEDLVKIAKQHKEVIFLENPRETLGNTAPTYKAILNTLDDPHMRNKFWKLNNGITATCTEFDATDDEKLFNVHNFKVVNGRQTVYTLEKSIQSTDDVFLLVILHEAVDDNERNQISEATNTQNPIKPVDLVTNYPEMIDLMVQCKRNFNNFYFERQSKGFKSTTREVQARVTNRRVLEKNSSARVYCAYAINPNDAMMPERILFSVTENDNYYNKIFKDRKIEELIIPHIFMQMLNELHRKWCRELTSEPTEKTSRKKGIISKDIVKYFILRFIYKSMMSIDEERRNSIKEKIIEKFQNLGLKDNMPEEFLNIAESAYDTFMFSFDADRKETWPEEIIKRIESKGYESSEQDKPTPYEIMYVLKQKGENLLHSLLAMREHVIKQPGDHVQKHLLELDQVR